jgi:hypothetical protein
MKPKSPYVCPGCSNRIYGEQYGEQIQYLIKLKGKIFTKWLLGPKGDYKQAMMIL